MQEQGQRERTLLNTIQEAQDLSRRLRNKMEDSFNAPKSSEVIEEAPHPPNPIDWGIEMTVVTCENIKVCMDILGREILNKLVGGDRP